MQRLFFILLALVWADWAVAGDDFCGANNEPAHIYSKIPITSSGNLKDYLATNSSSRIGTINDLLTLTPSLGAGNGADLSQVAAYLTSLNDFHDYMMASSSEGIGQLISERLAGEINKLFDSTQTINRRIRFNGSVDEVTKGNGYTASGTYTFIGNDNISISIKITRLSDAESRTFVSVGEPLVATKRLAQRIFKAFQLPSNQSVFNPFHDKTWVSLGGSMQGEAMRMNNAVEYCEILNARLPTKIEMILANKLGPFVSGVNINDNGSYIVTDDDKLTVLEPSTGNCPISINEVSLQYLVVCIQD